MERIKNQTSATLDRMTLLQQRYRQHQELMKGGNDSVRRTSIGSQNNDDLVVRDALLIKCSKIFVCD